MTSHDTAHDFRRAAVTALESLGISVEFSHHEVAPGQQEIDLRYADALSMADNIMTFRHVIKEVALAHGAHATFMPKPFRHQPGSGMHTHVSLFEGDRNAFHDSVRRAEPVQDGACLHRRPAPARPRDHRGHQPVGQLLQAAVRLRRPGRARRGADLRLLGARQPVGAGPGADVQARQGELDPRRAALDRLGLQPLPRLRRACWPPG